jgi:hypothetical protein
VKNSVYCVLAFLALGGCLEGIGPDDDPETTAVDQGVTQTLPVDQRSFGGNIFAENFPYATSQTCDSGFVRQSVTTQWTSQVGGNCSFQGWLTPTNPADCRATILAHTGGGFFGGTCTTTVTEVSGGTFTYAASNTNSAQQNNPNISIFLLAGQTVTVGTCGIEGATATGDTFLRLIGPLGNQVALNDDACGLASQFTFVASTQGTYTLRAGCFANSSCNGIIVWHIN